VSLYPPPAPRPTFAATLQSFAQGDGLPFRDALSEQYLQDVADQEGVDFARGPDDVWTPAVTLWALLAQCLSGSKSCVAAVARVLVLRVALGLPPCSAATGAYCKARAKLPERLLQRLTLAVGRRVEEQAPDHWRWHGKRVLLADGTEASLPDTPENQRDYPQPVSQKPGLGFPQMRLVVLLCFATACLAGCAMGPCRGKETGETALFRSLLEEILRGDVVVADRYYCSYWMVALLGERGADCCFRLHQRRRYDFRRGRRLGRGDHVVTWAKPARPEWMDEDTYARLPDTLTVREVRFVVSAPGARSREVIVATTLTDAQTYPKADIAELYHKRWHVELDIRSIKQTLKMDQLSCKTPAMARKEVWAHLLAYNLVRKAMAEAAWANRTTPRQLSFAGAVQTLNAFRWALLLCGGERQAELVRAVLLAIGTHRVGDRPGRCEPRKVKRRPKGYPWMTKPRAQERAELLQEQQA
jgi:Transposase DDE domain